MSVHPFAGFNPKPSAWGYNWTDEEATKTPQATRPPSSPEPQLMATQLAHMPAALINSLKREKKPFTYTPGGVNLNEVLNARLQKRLERKKKYYSEERDEPPKQVVVMPTHNSPLDMYSMENAIEALEVQAALVANDKSLSATLPRNHRFQERGVAQSKAFRVLQIVTDTDEEPASGRVQHHDEMRFTGIRDSKSIPSRFFHTLQKITGTEEEETVAPPKQRTDPPVVPQHPALKRPAAFLPIKTTPGTGFRSVQPPFLANGSIRQTVVHRSDL